MARSSDPPVSSRGVSWKGVLAALGIMAAIVLPTGTGLVGFGRVLQQIDELREEVRGVRELRRDVDRHETEIAWLKNRRERQEQR